MNKTRIHQDTAYRFAVGLVGTIVVRFQPSRVSPVLFGMALAQALVGIITAVAGLGFQPSSLPGSRGRSS